MKRFLQKLADYRPYPHAGKTHAFLIILGVFMLLQDLLALNAQKNAGLASMIKYVDEAIPIVLFVLLVLSRISRGRLLRRTELDAPLLFFLVMAVISSIFANVRISIIAYQFVLYIKAFLLFYVIMNLPVSLAVFNNYLRIFLIIGALFFIFGVVDLFFPAEFRRLTGNNRFIEYRFFFPSVQSLFTHPGIFGWFMTFIGLYCFAYAIIVMRPIFLWGGFLFFLGGFLSMRARTIFGFMAGIVIALFFVPSKKRILLIGVLIPFIILGFFLLRPALSELVESKIYWYVEIEDPLEQARNALYLKSVEIAGDYFPLGAGMGRYGSYMSRIYYSPLYEAYALSRVWGLSSEYHFAITDTFWPMILGETGVLGCGFYVLVLIAIFRKQLSFIKKSGNARLKAFHLGTLLILINAIIASIADAPFISPPQSVFIMGALGLSWAVGAGENILPP